ncbi:MAG: heavy metal translocating P-type ATPase [Peptococcaceae bacterium]
MKEKFDVTGMTCSACSSRVEKCVSKLDGMQDVSVNLLTNSMQVEFDQTKLSTQQIISAVTQAGYGASVKGEYTGNAAAAATPAQRQNPVEAQLKEMKRRLIISFVFLIPLMYVSMGHMVGLPLPSFLSGHQNAVSFAFTQFLLALPVVYINRNFFIKGFQTLAHGAPNMDSLIAIGSGAALVYGIFAIYRMSYGLGSGNMDLVARYHMDLYFESAVMILALITVGKYLETRSKGKTSEALTRLMDLAPQTATVERNGQQMEIPVEQVLVGDTVVVKPGQRIPVDGQITQGSTSVDQSAITGESIPVEKEPGDTVIAATINKGGFIRFTASKVGNDTTFAQIIRLVEDASATKAPIAKMADRIAGVFVPVVICIALLTAVVWLLLGQTFEFALSCAISVLVISCPCALGLATPVAIMVGTGKGAEHGILIKSGQALETAHNIQTVVLDKTGTITQGKPVVTDVQTILPDRQSFIAIAAALEQGSEHPLAEAVMHYAAEQNIAAATSEQFQSLPGKGVQAVIDGTQYYAGNRRLMDEQHISLQQWDAALDALATAGKTPLIFADSKQVIGIIGAADIVKATSRQAIQQLKQMGVQVVMLTGDNARTAAAIQQQLDIDEVIAEVLPQDKEQRIAALQAQGKVVAMVGDGVNDAPALARANVGLAIGAGTDIALESADIILMKNDLLDVVTAIQLSKAVIRNIKQNLFWAFFYNCLGIPLAAGVLYPAFHLLLSPMFGAAAMSFSSIFVVSNALRLRWFHPVLPAADSRQSAAHAEQTVSVTTAIAAQQADTSAPQSSKPAATSKDVQKTMQITGMMCSHCQNTVTKALNKLDGVTATVSLEDNAAYITTRGIVSDDVLKQAVIDQGYQVDSLTDDAEQDAAKQISNVSRETLEIDNHTNNQLTKETTTRKKVMKIEGMMCPHCQNAVTKALNGLEGVTATVSLEDKAAYITTEGIVSDDAMKQVVIDGGYKVIELTDAE